VATATSCWCKEQLYCNRDLLKQHDKTHLCFQSLDLRTKTGTLLVACINSSLELQTITVIELIAVTEETTSDKPVRCVDGELDYLDPAVNTNTRNISMTQ
jgi:hypothetical protein